MRTLAITDDESIRTWSGIGHKPQEHGSLFNMLPFLTLITFN